MTRKVYRIPDTINIRDSHADSDIMFGSSSDADSDNEFGPPSPKEPKHFDPECAWKLLGLKNISECPNHNKSHSFISTSLYILSDNLKIPRDLLVSNQPIELRWN